MVMGRTASKSPPSLTEGSTVSAPRESTAMAGATASLAPSVEGAIGSGGGKRSATFRAIFRQMVASSRSRFRTPASRVYSRITRRNAASLNFTCLSVRPCSPRCRPTRKLRAMCNFSSSVYPGRSITSIRSRNGDGTVSNWLAVAMNITCERS